MRDFRLVLYETKELTEDIILSIARIKNQHWKHTEEEHVEWFRNNIKSDDIHLLMYAGDALIAYLDAVHIDVLVNKKQYRMIGIGNVCVSRGEEGIGIGKIIMSAINMFIKENRICGLLLCHDERTPFYEKTGWRIIRAKNIIVNDERFGQIIMKYDPYEMIPEKLSSISIDRAF